MPINDYPPPSQTYQGRSSTITRSVPQKCQVCKGRSQKAKAECEPCKGKGWLMITETEHFWDNNYTPYVAPQPYTPPTTGIPGSWPGQTFCSVSIGSVNKGNV